MRSVLVLFASSACASATQVGPAAVEHSLPNTDPIFGDWVPDYRKPIDHVLPAPQWRSQPLDAVVERCRAGDVMSCRAIPPYEWTELPGGHGRAHAICSRLDPACDAEAMMTECRSGFPRSCIQISRMLHNTGVPEVVAATRERMRTLSHDGCAIGIAEECTLLVLHGDRDDVLFAREVECRSDAWACEHLGYTLLERDRDRALRAFEYACQEGRNWVACERLAVGYARGEFPEPVPGRAPHLMEWACHVGAMGSYVGKAEKVLGYIDCLAYGGMVHGQRRPE